MFITRLIIFLIGAFCALDANSATISNFGLSGSISYADASTAPQYPAGSSHFDMTVAGNYFDIIGSVSQLGYLETSVYARAIFSTTSTSVIVDGYTNYAYVGNGAVGVRVNGADNQVINFTKQGAEQFTITLPAGAKTVEFIQGAQQYHSPIQGSWITGLTFLSDASVTKVTPTPSSKMVIFGDSISIGFGSTNPTLGAWPNILRAYWTTGGIVNYGQGALALSDICTNASTCQALANKLTSNFSGATNKYIYLQISTNDWSRGAILSTWQTNYALLIDYIHTNDSSIHVFTQTPMPRGSGNGEVDVNSEGKVIGDFRTAISSVCTARSSYCSVVDGTAILSFPSDFGDTVHPTNAAQQKYADYVKTVLGI